MNRTAIATRADVARLDQGASFGDWLKAKTVTVLRRWGNLVDATSDPLMGNGPSSSGVSVDMGSVLGLSTAWGCVNLLAGTFGTLPVMMYQRDQAGDRQAKRDHPLFRILHDQPNTEQTALEFWEFMTAALELKGSAYAEKLTMGGRLVGLVPIAPDLVSPYRSRETGRVRYKLAPHNGRSNRDLDTTDMFHVRGFGGDALGGLSTIAMGRQVFGAAIAVDRAAASTFANGMRPSGILKFANWLKDDQRDRARKYLAEEYADSQRTGQPLVLEGGSTWEQVTMNPDDVQMLQSRQFNVEEVCRWFGVPPVMVGHAGAGVTNWGTGVEAVKLMFHTSALARRARRFEQAIAQQLMTPADRAAGYYAEFNMEAFLRGDSAGRTRFYAAGIKDGWLNQNEVRRRENMGPVPGGEIYRVQSQNVPLDAPPAPPPVVQTVPAAKADLVDFFKAMRGHDIAPAPQPIHVHLAPTHVDVQPPAISVDLKMGTVTVDVPAPQVDVRVVEADPRPVLKTVTSRDDAGNILTWKEEAQ